MRVKVISEALDALFGDVAARAARARALLYSERTAFVLVVGAKERLLADGDDLAATMVGLGVPLRAAVVNRVHPLSVDGEVAPASVGRVLAELAVDPATSAWLRETWSEAKATAAAERERLRAFAAALAPGIAWVEVPELDHDAHSLRDLDELARVLGAVE